MAFVKWDTVVKWNGRMARWGATGALMLCAVSMHTLSVAAETFETLTQKADAIVIGKCLAKQCVVRKGLFVTTHEVLVQEALKGKSLKSGQTVSVASLGGSFSKPPISQYVNDQPTIAEGEEVLLFLQEPTPQDKAKAADFPELAASTRVVAGGNGKFSIITDPKDKQRKVVRARCEDYGVLPDERLLRTILGALEKGELETTDTSEFVDLGGGVRGPKESKAILDNAVRISDSLKKAKPAELTQKMRENTKAIPAPTVAEVKTKIANILSAANRK